MNGRISRPEHDARLELPEVGRLHIGQKSEKGYPMSIDWFRCTGKYAGLFERYVGKQPRSLQVIFPSDDAETVCNERYELRTGDGRLFAYGDGESFRVWTGKEYGEFSTSQNPNLMNEVMKASGTKTGWNVTLSLLMIVPAVRGVVGAWRLNTKGAASSIPNIRQSFDGVKAIRGTVTQTVFDLSVEFAKSNKPGVSSRYPVLSLTANDNAISQIRELIAPADSVSMLLNA